MKEPTQDATFMRDFLAADLKLLNGLLDEGKIGEARKLARRLMTDALTALTGEDALRLYYKLKEIAGP